MTFNRWEKPIFNLAIFNFPAFIAVDLWLGGDPLNGKAEAGRYLLNNHGQYTEVSHPVFVYSQIHATSIFITHALAFLAFYRAKARTTRKTISS